MSKSDGDCLFVRILASEWPEKWAKGTASYLSPFWQINFRNLNMRTIRWHFQHTQRWYLVLNSFYRDYISFANSHSVEGDIAIEKKFKAWFMGHPIIQLVLNWGVVHRLN